ncbi:hypothetical protein [Cloacibacillus sp. An23]|uniref:hypothetical protein n=1 Tax=Cloacibacillus sp. An23 TaxID=1965591 RepID=UPI00117829D9|nr:hypothetical protein [Cloacibacillus sp. An23]
MDIAEGRYKSGTFLYYVGGDSFHGSKPKGLPAQGGDSCRYKYNIKRENKAREGRPKAVPLSFN